MTGSAELYSVSPALLHNKFHGFFVTTDKYTPDIKGSWVCVRRFPDPLPMNQCARASLSKIGSSLRIVLYSNRWKITKGTPNDKL